MDKKIKDYLHLYLGCDLQFPLSQSPSTNGVLKLTPELLSECHECEEWLYIKPIFRPLSDMTEEDKFFDLTTNSEYERVRQLLSKHFDIFGLIESGLAIDATTLKNNHG